MQQWLGLSAIAVVVVLIATVITSMVWPASEPDTLGGQGSAEDPSDWWRITCDELHRDIIRMSKMSDGPEILGFVGDAGLNTGRTGKRLDCFAEVRTTVGKFYIDYFLERDPGGEEFIGYKLDPQ